MPSGRPSPGSIVAAGFVVAAAFVALAVVELAVRHDAAMGVPLIFMSILISGPLAVVARSVVAPPPAGSPPERDGSRHDGPDGCSDPAAPWWPDFERDLMAWVAARERESSRPPT